MSTSTFLNVSLIGLWIIALYFVFTVVVFPTGTTPPAPVVVEHTSSCDT